METINTKIIVPDKCRFSFVHLMEKFAFDNTQEAKFSVRLLIPKTAKATLTLISQTVQAMMTDPKVKAKLGTMPAKKIIANMLHDGDDDAERYPEQAGCYYLNMSNTRPVDVRQVIGGQMVPVTDPTEIYSGCYGHASFNLFAYDRNGNKGISCSLNNVLKTEDGDSLGGTASRACDDFADLYPTAAAPAGENADMNDLLNIG